MIATLAAFLAALTKILPTIGQLGDLLYQAYAAKKKADNEAKLATAANRDDAAIAAAAGGLPKLCATCPVAQHSAGRNSPADPAS